MPKKACSAASSSARIRAKWPSSGSMSGPGLLDAPRRWPPHRPARRATRPGASSASLATSGGMYFSSCLASTSSATKVPSARRLAVRHHALRPRGTGPAARPCSVTGTSCLKSVTTKRDLEATGDALTAALRHHAAEPEALARRHLARRPPAVGSKKNVTFWRKALSASAPGDADARRGCPAPARVMRRRRGVIGRLRASPSRRRASSRGRARARAAPTRCSAR